MELTRSEAVEEIRGRWRDLFPADRKHGIICPLCGSGSGENGSGITESKRMPGMLKCWACDFRGDALDLIQRERGINFSQAFEYAAERLGLTVKKWEGKKDMEDGERLTQKEILFLEEPEKAPDYTSDFLMMRDCLQASPEGLSYLKGRGISADTARRYCIGFDPEWKSPAAVREGRNPPASPRIIIPCGRDRYEARDIRKDAGQYAKMNEGGKGIFNLRGLYGGADACFVTEGPFDALSLLEVGETAIALCSVSCVTKLISALEDKPTDATLIICLDRDDAGKRATEALTGGLKRLNVPYIIADITGSHKDPNEALTADRAAFVEAVGNAKDAIVRPDNVSGYIDSVFVGDIERFRGTEDRRTGFPELDKKLDGLHSGLYVLAAASSLGKTTFALQLADQVAAGGSDAVFFSLEMSRLELVSKSIARTIAERDPSRRVTSLMIRRGLMDGGVLAAIETYKQRVKGRLSIVEGGPGCGSAFIADYVRRYIDRTGKRPVIIIDYLQIVDQGEDRQQRRDVIDQAVVSLRRLSRECGISVIVVSSLNRANYAAPVDFESLKESGGIEYSADVVLGLQLQCLDEDLFQADKKIVEKRERLREARKEIPRKIRLVCLKNRFGVASFEQDFKYYPDTDLFMEQEPEQPKASGSRKRF